MFPEVPKKFPSIMAKLKTATAVEIGNVRWKFPKSELSKLFTRSQ
jgi:hypothetical protein